MVWDAMEVVYGHGEIPSQYYSLTVVVSDKIYFKNNIVYMCGFSFEYL